MATAEKRALIVGGGLGGLSTALALRRTGWDPIVFERVPDLRQAQVGGGLHLWPNALRVLRQLGIVDRVEAAGARQRRAEFVTASGKPIADADLDEHEREYGVAPIGISRGALHEILTEAVGDALETSADCTGFDQDADGVTARFSDGREERGSFLVAADGLHSRLRARLHAGEPEPFYVGYAIWRALLENGVDLTPPGTFRIVWGPGARFVFYPVGGQRLYWAAIANAPEGGDDPPEGRKASLLARFEGWPDPTTRLIEAANEQAIFRTDNYTRKPAKRWGEGRVTLLGDAAHPMLFNVGQGACQSMEDAIVLARNLSESDDVASALRAYEASRMPPTAKLMKLSLRLGRLGRFENPLSCAIRNAVQKKTIRVGFLKTGKPAEDAVLPQSG